MAAKVTIALIGLANGICSVLVHTLAKANYRLLLVTKDGNDIEHLTRQINLTLPGADVEVIDCVKNGCWEADIIVFVGANQIDHAFINKIKAVSTQKIVVALSINKTGSNFDAFESKNIQLLLPHSKVVQLFNQYESTEAFIAGDDSEALQTVAHIIKNAGYQPTVVDSFPTKDNM